MTTTRSATGYIALLLFAILVAGCASMSQDQCRHADWTERGQRDGREGYKLSRIDEHREACAKVGVSPDSARWQWGYSAGIREYCAPNSAWNAGLANRYYAGSCALHDEDGFLRYYRAGQALHRARQEFNRNQSDIERLEAELKKADKDEERKRLREHIGRLDRERQALRRQLEALELTKPRW